MSIRFINKTSLITLCKMKLSPTVDLISSMTLIFISLWEMSLLILQLCNLMTITTPLSVINKV